MNIRTDARFVIRAGNEYSRLFSVGEDEEGGTVLFLRSSQLFRPPGLPGGPLAAMMPQIKIQKYSIHASADSAYNNTYINHTMLMSDKSKFKTEYVTQALKGKQNFVFLFCRRCADLRIPTFRVKARDTNLIKIGSYNPDFFTLFYAVIVCAPEETSPLEDIEGFWYGKYNVFSQRHWKSLDHRSLDTFVIAVPSNITNFS